MRLNYVFKILGLDYKNDKLIRHTFHLFICSFVKKQKIWKLVNTAITFCQCVRIVVSINPSQKQNKLMIDSPNCGFPFRFCPNLRIGQCLNTKIYMYTRKIHFLKELISQYQHSDRTKSSVFFSPFVLWGSEFFSIHIFSYVKYDFFFI